MRVQALLISCAVIALPAFAQEPQPARIGASALNGPGGVELTLAWRFAPGDAADRALPQFDDSKWRTASPQQIASWSGIGWFRRHLLIDPVLQGRRIALRFESPELADVYLDGRLVLSTRVPKPEISFDQRLATTIEMSGAAHVIAVRYLVPTGARRPQGGIGFTLTLASPGVGPGAATWIDVLQGNAPESVPWVAALQGAILALPIFLGLLHLALFAFDQKARENLFYAGEMVAFESILLHDFGAAIIPSEGLRSRIAEGGPAAAIFFGMLTYYAVRTRPFPRTWRAFVVAGVAAFAASYLVPDYQQPIWIAYFVFMIVEIARIESGGRALRHDRASSFFIFSFTIFGLTIVLQILVNYGLFESIGGFQDVYVIGIVVSAIGMSLYLAGRIGQSRLIEAENKRKSEELAQARALQLSMLPRTVPEARGLDVAPMTQTAAEVGGDYYDVRAGGDGALLFAFGDATGHGLASGIVVTAAKALFNSLPADGSPGEMLERCDRTFRGMQLPSLRMCLALARVTLGEAVVASAAMPPILIHRHATDRVEELGRGGLPLGSRIESRYEVCRARLEPGDTLLFASDGLAELLDPAGRPFGYEALAAAFREAAAAGTAREVIDTLQSAASRFRGARPLSDDITLIAIRVRP